MPLSGFAGSQQTAFHRTSLCDRIKVQFSSALIAGPPCQLGSIINSR